MYDGDDKGGSGDARKSGDCHHEELSLPLSSKFPHLVRVFFVTAELVERGSFFLQVRIVGDADLLDRLLRPDDAETRETRRRLSTTIRSPLLPP